MAKNIRVFIHYDIDFPNIFHIHFKLGNSAFVLSKIDRLEILEIFYKLLLQSETIRFYK